MAGHNNMDHPKFTHVPLYRVPIHIVTKASQLPIALLEPSPRSELVIGFDCEGTNLCRDGILCVMQFAFPDAVYLIDAIEGGKALIKACKPALESKYIKKVIHDCKWDSEVLYFKYGIKLNNVMDTQIAYSLIEEQEGGKKPADPITFVDLLEDPRYCELKKSMPNGKKEDVNFLIQKVPDLWERRPLNEQVVLTAVDDVRFLLYIYHQMMEKLNELSLWYLGVRSALYGRCFCVGRSRNNYADWPSLPPIPDELKADGNGPEKEILSALVVPPEKLGVVIGKGNANISSIKESCNAEILTRGSNGPRNLVCIMGPESGVKKAEALILGRLGGMKHDELLLYCSI